MQSLKGREQSWKMMWPTLIVVTAATLCAAVQGKAPLGSFHASLMEYVFEERKPMPTALSDMTTDTVDSERILLVGGCAAEVQNNTGCKHITNVARFYFPATETFESVKNLMPVARSRHGAAIRNNQLYVIGGEGPVNAEYPLEINVLDLETETWTTLIAQLPEPIVDGVAFEFEGLVYFTGGYLPKQGYALNALTYLIDLNNDLRNDGPVLKTPRGDSRAEILNDKVYIIGGFDSTFEPLSSMETFDGTAWTTHPVSMDVSRGDLATAVLNGMIYAFGGETVIDGVGTVTGSVEIFNPLDSENGNWSHAGELDPKRHRFDASGLGHVVYLFGGQKLDLLKEDGVFQSDHVILKTVEAFLQKTSLNSSAPTKSPTGVSCDCRVMLVTDRTFSRKARETVDSILQFSKTFVSNLAFGGTRLGHINLKQHTISEVINIEDGVASNQTRWQEYLDNQEGGFLHSATQFWLLYSTIADKVSENGKRSYIVLVTDGILQMRQTLERHVELKRRMINRLGADHPEIICVRVRVGFTSLYLWKICDKIVYDGFESKSLSIHAQELASYVCDRS